MPPQVQGGKRVEELVSKARGKGKGKARGKAKGKGGKLVGRRMAFGPMATATDVAGFAPAAHGSLVGSLFSQVVFPGLFPQVSLSHAWVCLGLGFRWFRRLGRANRRLGGVKYHGTGKETDPVRPDADWTAAHIANASRTRTEGERSAWLMPALTCQANSCHRS